MSFWRGQRFRGGASGDVLAVSTLTSAGDRAGKAVREKSNLLNRFNLIWVVQPALQKFPASH
jgi:hypothetical protein